MLCVVQVTNLMVLLSLSPNLSRLDEEDVSGSTHRHSWKKKLSELQSNIKQSSSLRKSSVPVSLMLQLIFGAQVAVAALPNTAQVMKQSIGAAANIVVGTYRAVFMGNPGQLMQGMCDLGTHCSMSLDAACAYCCTDCGMQSAVYTVT